ncbi:lytic polysaccharide monooxygenase [Cohnella mopanensis]|uniref:lytic polysaccharide monooxygenase n=1 Tax=Cohnella mopanensis TaxID=2911966 RepID=UPI001EF9B6E7|nr:lytic polysaccharide monooxygenase [Cohnella mopanensis]
MSVQETLKQPPSRIMMLLMGTGALLLILVCSLLFADRASAHGRLIDSRADLCMSGLNTDCGPVQYEPWSVEGRGDFPEIGVPDGQIAGGGKYPPLDAQTMTRWTKVNLSGGLHTFKWKLVANHSTNYWDYYITKPGWDPNKPLARTDLEKFCRYEDNGAIPPVDVSNDCFIPNDREGYHVIVAVWDIFDTINAFYQAMDVNLTRDLSQPTTPAPGFPGDPNRFGAIRDWSSIRPYNTGEQVVYSGNIWQARWYTLGQTPGTNEVWQLIGPVTGTTIPAAPTGLTATAGNAQVSLSWTASAGATSYTVKRATTAGGPYTNVLTGVTATSYTNTGLTNGMVYYYVVSASNSAGESANSSQASATPIAGTTIPAAPTGLTATAGNAQVALSWTASAGATSYTVKRATTSGGPYTNVATGVTATSYTNTGLTNGTAYYYVVSASNSAGSSANSAQVSATPTAGTTIPAAPAGLTATAGNAQVSLSWTASAGATSYTVKRATTAGGPYTNVATGVTATSYTNTGLTNGTIYYYVVSASNTAGESANSAQASATPIAGTTIPAAPAGLTVTTGNAQVSLSWTASAGATSYTVKRATTTGGPYTNVASGVTATSYTNTGLTNGTVYYYVVSASNTAGESANSSQASATPTGGSTGTGSLVIQYKVGDTSATDNQIKPYLNIKNTGTSAVSLSTIKVRYYFTKDGTAALNAFIDWAQIGGSNITTTFVSASGINTDTYVELGFTAGAGTIAAGGQTGDIQLRLAKADWSNFNEANDYSYDPTKTAYANWDHVTLYQNGTLVWGTAP